MPLLERVPGFVAHYMLDAGNNILTSLTLSETNEGAKAASRILDDWFRSDWPAFQQVPPDLPLATVLSADAMTGRTRAAPSETGEASVAVHPEVVVPERRSGIDRRAFDRRAIPARRQQVIPVETERRSGADRRVGQRRASLERRANWPAAKPAPPAPPPRRHRIAPPWKRREPFQSK